MLSGNLGSFFSNELSGGAGGSVGGREATRAAAADISAGGRASAARRRVQRRGRATRRGAVRGFIGTARAADGGEERRWRGERRLEREEDKI